MTSAAPFPPLPSLTPPPPPPPPDDCPVVDAATQEAIAQTGFWAEGVLQGKRKTFLLAASPKQPSFPKRCKIFSKLKNLEHSPKIIEPSPPEGPPIVEYLFLTLSTVPSEYTIKTVTFLWGNLTSMLHRQETVCGKVAKIQLR